MDQQDQEGMVESIENLEDTRGLPVREYVVQVGPRTECANRFKNFLRTFVDAKGHNLYREKIRQMCEGKYSYELSAMPSLESFPFMMIISILTFVLLTPDESF